MCLCYRELHLPPISKNRRICRKGRLEIVFEPLSVWLKLLNVYIYNYLAVYVSFINFQKEGFSQSENSVTISVLGKHIK